MPTLRPRKSTRDEDEERNTKKRPTRRRVTRRMKVVSEATTTESEEDDDLLAQMKEDLLAVSPQKKVKSVEGRRNRRVFKKMKVEEEVDEKEEDNKVEDETKEQKKDEMDVIMLEEMQQLTTTAAEGELEEVSLTVTSLQEDMLLGSEKGRDKVEILNAGGEEGLHRNYQETRRLGEEYAVEFLANSTKHPVLTCFRELTGSDISHLLATQKMKKLMGCVPLSLVYMGLVDYMAVTVDNPFYADDTPFRKQMKNVPAKVIKIMNEFKSILTSWGVSDYMTWKERYSTAMSFLHAQVPLFKGINFDESYAAILTGIESEIATRNKQKCEFKTSGIRKYVDAEKSQTSLNTSLTEDQCKDDLEVIEDESASEVTVIPLNLKSSTTAASSWATLNLKSPSSSSRKPYKSITKRSATPSTPTNEAKESKESKFSPIVSAFEKQSESRIPLSPTKNLLNKSSEIPSSPKQVSCLPGPSKKLRLESPEERENKASDVSVSVTVQKPKLNAFALLMNKSKEIAEQKKLKKQLDTTHRMPVAH